MAEAAEAERSVPRMPAPPVRPASKPRVRKPKAETSGAEKPAKRRRVVHRRKRRKQRDDLETTLLGLLRLYRSLKKS